MYLPDINVASSEEDRYALFRNNARLIRRDVTSTIDLTQKVRYSKGRKWTINKAKKENLNIIKSNDYKTFWSLLISVLESKYRIKPLHSLEEIEKLSKLFDKNIKLYLIKKKDIVLSGALIYENNFIVHTQYLASSELGREVGSLDLLIDCLVKEIYKDKRYFDFGISNENDGRYLNKGLILQKEGFGAKSVVHDFYEVVI